MATIQGSVMQYPYRKAFVADPFLSIPRELLKELEENLAAAAGVRADNHTVYEFVQDKDKPPLYIMFSDFTVTFAHAVDARSW